MQVRANQIWTKKLVNQALIEASEHGLKTFFLAIVEKTWTKELEDGKAFFKKISFRKIIKHLESMCVDLEPADAINIWVAMLSRW